MNVTLFESRVFADDQVKMSSLGWALIQDDWCPYKKAEFGHEDTHGEDDVKTPEHHLQAKEGQRPPEAGEGLEQTLPRSPQKEPTPPTL